MSVVAAARGTFLEDNDNNQVLNSNFDQDNYPVWTAFNGQKFDSTTTKETGDAYKGIADWIHYSPLFNQGYGSFVGNQFLFHYTPYELDGFDGDLVPRIIKLFGANQLWVGSINNDDADRGASTFGEFTDGAYSRMVSNTTTAISGINAVTDIDNDNLFIRTCEWQQQIAIPDGTTSVKFGARIRVPSNDDFKDGNWAGIYCAEDRNPTAGVYVRYVNYFGIRKSTESWSLPTGSLSSAIAPYNWNGMSTDYGTGNDIKYFTHTACNATQHAMLNTSDYRDFKKVEYTFTPQSGTNRRMSINLFFAEKGPNVHDAPPGNTGGFQVYDPFVEFS